MENKDNQPKQVALSVSSGKTLRRRAEDIARKKVIKSDKNMDTLSPEKTRQLLKERQVDQIELEMQNEELQREQIQQETRPARYFAPYDIAPVGYLSISEKGLIMEANLTAATLLNVTRGSLVKQPLSRFIIKEEHDLYHQSRKHLFETGDPQECDLRIMKNNGSPLWVKLASSVVRDDDGTTVSLTVIVDITKRKQAEGNLRKSERLLGFETLLSELSAQFISLPLDRVDADIIDALRRIMEFFQVDRCGILEVSPEQQWMRVTHAANAEGITPVSQDINLFRLFPWLYEKVVVNGQTFSFETLDELPPEALKDKQVLAFRNTISALYIPISVNGRISYMIALNAVRTQHSWPEEYIPRLRLMSEVLVNTLRWRKDRLELEEQLRFEMLLADISGQFINLSAEKVHGEIEDAQRRVCECLGLDLSALWEWSSDPLRILTLTHLYRPLGGPPVPDPMDAHEHFPWCQQQLEAGKTVVVSSMDQLPAEAAKDKETWLHFGIKTTVTIPLRHGGEQPIGAVSFNSMLTERNLPELLVTRLQLVAQMFINALSRKQTETRLRESEARLSLTTEAVDAGLWIMDIDTGSVWGSEKCRKLFHFDPDEEICYESFFSKIHHEDRDTVHREVQQSLQAGKVLRCDYRIVLPDGCIRWILARGQRFANPTGEPIRLLGLSLDITDSKDMEERLKNSLEELQQLKKRLQIENVYLREEVKLLYKHTEIVGESKPLKDVLAHAEKVSKTDSTVLLLGETGTGKELLAHAIHEMSARRDRTLIIVNCASLPPTLIESELFGREKGAYTGSLTKMMGRFELADESTLFLDEIGDLPSELQSKLLRVLEQGEFERLGSSRTLKVNVRLIAATNHDITQDVKNGRFRKDLYYRLNVFPITIPPLRDRQEDIPALVWSFVKQFEKVIGKTIESIPQKDMDALMHYPWPGNIRELRNVIEHAMIISFGKILHVKLPAYTPMEQSGSDALQDIERKHILEVLERTQWHLSGKNGAAELLGMKRTTLQSKMKALGIKRKVS